MGERILFIYVMPNGWEKIRNFVANKNLNKDTDMMQRIAMRVMALAMVLTSAAGLRAQNSQAEAMMKPLPVDTTFRQGVLPNGLTYYIRHNELPKGQADYYIAQKVGSILENDNQRGLAHFLEHMCFNGTQNFAGNEVVNWLQTKGVEFGGDLNAYTSVDETVYRICNVPTDNVAVQDSCLLILHDWADGLLLLDEEIEKERGVIHQEWRLSQKGQMRALEKMLPEMYPGSKYGYRLPIGIMEVVDSFPPQVIRDYYETWYRPDQQGIIVVGDIDVDRVESKIKELFGPIQMPQNPQERVYEPVPNTEGTIVSIGSDPEISNDLVSIFFKQEVVPLEQRNTIAYWLQDYVTDMIAAMLNQRYSDISARPDAPFAQADASYGGFFLAKTADALELSALAKDGDIPAAAAAAYRELLRAQRGGFTAGEYDRARKEYLSRLERQYNNREKVENGQYAQPVIRHFIDNTPATDIETKYQFFNMMAPNIPVEAVNMTLAQLVTPDNRVVMALAPEKEGHHVPTKEELLAALAAVDAETIEPYVDEMKTEPLIPQLPKPGTIVSTKPLEQWGAEEWTLSNGAKVVVKKTDFKADEILFGAMALGGTSVIADELAPTLIFYPYGLQQSGLGSYSYSDMQKYLQGKQVNVELDFGDYLRQINGATTPKDLPTLMELIYMNFTNLAISADEFASTQNMLAAAIHNQETNPQFIFSRDLSKTLYQNPRKQVLDSETVKKADRQATLDITKQMTANAADYTFYFVGNVDLDTLRPLVEQYLATLPSDTANLTEIKRDGTLEINIKDALTTFTTKMETPQTFVAVLESADMPYTPQNVALADIAGQILSQRLLEKVREDMGAVYSIWASGNMSRLSKPNTRFQSVFPMKPEMKEQVLKLIADEFKALETTIKPEEVAKAVELNIKQSVENKEKNSPWLKAMLTTPVNGVDTFNGDVELYRTITPAQVQDFMKAVNAQNGYRVVVLDPAQ